jgi:ABC-type transporter lipoprotein component MlaA
MKLKVHAVAISALMLAVLLPATSLRAQNQTTNTTLALWDNQIVGTNEIPYFDFVPDPIEGFNRCSWAVNDWLFRGLIVPFSKGYTFVTPRPVRTSIGNAGHNLTYPVRLVNNCLQGKWHGAWAETERFFVNSTVGLAGLFDPATHWKIDRSDEDFGQTLGHWGSGPGFYIMLPILGPSNGRDLVGRIVDWPLDICFWIGVAYDDETWPMFMRPGFTLNDMSGEAVSLKLLLDSQTDPYFAVRTLYSLDRRRNVLDFIPADVGTNASTDQTVRAVFFQPWTPKFEEMAVTRTVKVPATGKKLPYSCWMQKNPAPVVYYLPGLGSYRLDRSSAAYCDMLYRHGYSVVVFSNPFQKEFMERASTMAVPGYGPADCDDVVNALKLIRADLIKWKGDKITGHSLTGVSHGGYFTLMTAAREAAGKLDGLSFDRYVAVEPPVQLSTALRHLDDLFYIALDWPAETRKKEMLDSIFTALYFAQKNQNAFAGNENGLDVNAAKNIFHISQEKIPLTLYQSEFLVGLMFRYTLMGVIYDSQSRHDLGVIKVPPGNLVRQPFYRAAREVSYTAYMDRFVLPYLIKIGRGTNAEALKEATSLEPLTDALKDNPKVRVQICQDDFLLSRQNIDWYGSTFGTNLTTYAHGGHLGNLHNPEVQEALIKMFPPAPMPPTKK